MNLELQKYFLLFFVQKGKYRKEIKNKDWFCHGTE